MAAGEWIALVALVASLVGAVLVAGWHLSSQLALHTAATDRLSDSLGTLSTDVKGLQGALQDERTERRNDISRIHERLDLIGRPIGRPGG